MTIGREITDEQCAYKATLWRVRVAIVVVEDILFGRSRPKDRILMWISKN